MKKIFSIVASSILLLQSVSATLTVISFWANRQEIATSICQQKSVAGNNCRGACFLKKQLASQPNDVKSVKNPVKEVLEMLYVGHTSSHYVFFFSAYSSPSTTYVASPLPDEIRFTDPRPPKLASS